MQRKARAPRGDLAFLVVGVTRDQLDLVFVLSGFKETKHSGFSRTYSAKSAGPGGGANGDACGEDWLGSLCPRQGNSTGWAPKGD